MNGHRMIGMVQPLDPQSTEAAPELYRTGCAGKIVSYSETPDNRYLITLGGVCRFTIVEELSATTPYRQALVSFSRFRDDLSDPDPSEVDMDRLLVALKAYLQVNEIPIDWNAIGETPHPAMIDSLAMICPFEPSEKQALIEAGDFEERCRVLTALSEMALVQYSQGGDSTMQ
jgi:Lon protease-like protein